MMDWSADRHELKCMDVSKHYDITVIASRKADLYLQIAHPAQDQSCDDGEIGVIAGNPGPGQVSICRL